MVSILAVLVAAYSSSLVCDTAFGSGVITNENVPIPATFQVLSNNSNICLLVQCNINLSSVDTKIPQPPIFPVVNSTNQDEFTATGSCNEHMETLQLIWKQNNSDSEWKLLFQFALNDKNNFNLTQINLSYEHNHSQVLSYASDNQSSFSCPVGSFYSCKAKQTIVLSSSDPSPLSAKLTVSQLKVEAFRNGLKPEFNGIMVQCPLDYQQNKIVPTVIGISLAVVIVIALVVFIVTSQRNRAGGTSGGGYQQI